MINTTKINDNVFYQAYDRAGQGTILKAKHVRQFFKDFVESSDFRPEMSVLELGCGNGLFLRYLSKLGVEEFMGVDGDPRILEELPSNLVSVVHISDFTDFFVSDMANQQFDRVV